MKSGRVLIKVLRRLGLGVLGLLFLALATRLTYPLWDGFGPWRELPTGEPPASRTLGDVRFAEVGRRALKALRTHRRRCAFPALTAGVSVQGDLVWSGAVGWANLETGAPATSATVMRIGSTSKAVTATAFARLVDRGEMALDASLSRYSDDWPNPAWSDLTPRQLLSHTAGLPEYDNNGDWWGKLVTLWGRRHYSSVRDSLAIFDGADLLYEPGTDFAYSSFDVNLLGAAMAASRKRPFLEVLERQVFDPLELRASGGDRDGATSRPRPGPERRAASSPLPIMAGSRRAR